MIEGVCDSAVVLGKGVLTNSGRWSLSEGQVSDVKPKEKIRRRTLFLNKAGLICDSALTKKRKKESKGWWLQTTCLMQQQLVRGE